MNVSVDREGAKLPGPASVQSPRTDGTTPSPRIPMQHILPLFIPIIALSIPLVTVIGKYIVQPLAAGRLPQPEDGRVQMLEQRLALMEQSMEAMERSMGHIAEVAEFHRELASAAPPSAPSQPPATV
jgi:hypothetical protein